MILSLKIQKNILITAYDFMNLYNYKIILQMFSEKGMTPIDRQLNKKIVRVIHGLLMMDESAAFRKPVPHKALGLDDYKLIVKKPTDLNLVRRQNNEGKYKFVEEVFDDIQLCWDNCKMYNTIESEIYKQAIFMQEAFDKFGLEILPDFWVGINREEYNQKFNQRKIEEDKKKPGLKTSTTKNESSTLLKENLESIKMKKKVTFTNRNGESSSLINEDNGEIYKERQENVNNEHVDSHLPSAGHLQKISMDVEQGQEIPEVLVQPVMVNLAQNPTKEQLLELSEIVKNIYQKEELSMLEKVVDILHSNEKENMTLNKNGQMSFNMSKIHVSTYLRLKKLIGLSEESVGLIE